MILYCEIFLRMGKITNVYIFFYYLSPEQMIFDTVVIHPNTLPPSVSQMENVSKSKVTVRPTRMLVGISKSK